MKKLLFILLFLCINLFGSQRIVTLAPSINEIVFALGLGKNVVANSLYSDYPKESKDLPKVGGYANISLEKILKFNPDVVIAQDYDLELLKKLNALGVKTLSFKTQTVEDIKNTIKDLGISFNKEKEAKDLINKIDNSLESLKNIITNKKILIVISPRKNLRNQIYVTGNYLYFEDFIKTSGNINAFFSESKQQPVVNVEKIIKINPDIIILLTPFLRYDDQKRNELKKLWKELPINASINNNIYTVHGTYAGIPSQRIIYFMKDFKKILENVRNK